MGTQISRILYSNYRKVIILGGEKTGKTSIFNILNSKLNSDPKPKCLDGKYTKRGFNVDVIKNIVLWDLCGMKSMIPFWKCYFNNVHGVIWVLEPNDLGVLDEMEKVLRTNELENCVVLIYINKMDMYDKSVGEIYKQAIIEKLKNRRLYVVSSDIRHVKDIIRGFEVMYSSIYGYSKVRKLSK